MEVFLDHYRSQGITEIYNKQHPIRRKLICPVEEPWDVLVKKWLEREYPSHNSILIRSEIYTEKGEQVRSKSEKIIADTLNRLQIPYRYEYPLTLKNGKIIYPDFTALHIREKKEIYFEHFGRMDDPSYSEKNVMKRIEDYERNGLWIGTDIIFTMESLENPLDTKLLENMLTHFFLS